MRSINFYKLLKSRVAAGIRRPRPAYIFDAPTGRLCAAGRESKLRPKTAALFQVLSAEPGRILSKDELLDRVWPGLFVQEQAVFQCINEIRRACGTKDCIRTHACQGYQWIGLPRVPLADDRARRVGRRAMLVAACCFGILLTLATIPVEPRSAADRAVRIAVLPVNEQAVDMRDRGLSLGMMDMLNRHGEALQEVQIIPASEVLGALEHNPGLGRAAALDALNADIIIQVAVGRHEEVLTAEFILAGRAGQVKGRYESASPAWLAQQIAYEIHDAVHYSLQPGADTTVRTARQQELIAARRLLHRSRAAAAAPAATALAAKDPAYSSAQYFALWTKHALGAPVTDDEIDFFLDTARDRGDRLNETRALLLATQVTGQAGDMPGAAAYADAGRSLASRHDLHYLEAAFDFGLGQMFAAQGAHQRAAAAFRQAEARYRRADCGVGLLATYQHLEKTYRAAGAPAEAQATAARIQALKTVFPQTTGSASRGTGRT